jgi:4-carboxymuconolactone decarboxylase
MSREVLERGLEIRKSVLGAAFVEQSFNSADDFNRPMQELVTEYCWGAVWGRESCPARPGACSTSPC